MKIGSILILLIALVTNLSAQTTWSGTSPGNIYYNSGNVGIGTSTPSSKLHIVSTGGIYSGLLLESSNAAGYASLDLKNSSGNLAQMALNGNSSENGMALSRQVSLSSSAVNGISLIAYDVDGFISFGTGGMSTVNERMRVVSNGNVLMS